MINVSLRQLQIFQAVVQAGNFSRAGEAIGLTQPAVSRAVTELEQQIGLRLLDRTTRDVQPTRAGVLLAQRLPRWLDELENTLQELHSWAGSRTGKVRVASSPTISAALMPACLAGCAAREPGIEVVLIDRIQQDVLETILAGEVDFGVIVEPNSLQARHLHCETILEDPFVVVCPENHPLAAPRGKSRPMRWRDLDGENVILLDHASGSRPLIDALLQKHNVAHQVVQQVGHVTTGFEMVRAGLGICVVPGLAIPETGLPGLAVRLPSPGAQRRVMLAHRKNRTISPLAQRLWSLVAELSEEAGQRRRGLWR